MGYLRPSLSAFHNLHRAVVAQTAEGVISVVPAVANASSSFSHDDCRSPQIEKSRGKFWLQGVCSNFFSSIPRSSNVWERQATALSFRRQLASKPQRTSLDDEAEQEEYLHFPGARVKFSRQMKFVPENPDEPTPCYQVLDEFGQELDPAQTPQVDYALATAMYRHMIILQTMDVIFYEAQRQGRFNFYMTTRGEEAINLASAAALSNEDLVFAQYREPGLLLWRGFTVDEFANQCFGNQEDYGKGRQMPIHYGSKELNYATVSSPIATQLPQAVGAAYGMKMDRQAACTVAFFGDGATSEGDFHGAMNFAAVLEVPVVFICRNNGWAISTPSVQQYKGDGLIARGRGYGIRSIRVDGNDTLAMYATVKEARRMAIEESRPIFIEALTYRVGHHSTSDDSSRYRPEDELKHWRELRDPVVRYRRWLEGKGWWSVEEENRTKAEARKKVLSAMTLAESKAKPPLSYLFTDVYDSVHKHLREQEVALRATVSRHPADYPENVPL